MTTWNLSVSDMSHVIIRDAAPHVIRRFRSGYGLNSLIAGAGVRSLPRPVLSLSKGQAKRSYVGDPHPSHAVSNVSEMVAVKFTIHESGFRPRDKSESSWCK